VHRIDIVPNKCPLASELKLTFEFTLANELKDAYWDFKYVVDSAGKRRVLELGESKRFVYGKGKNSFTFEAARVDVSSLEKHVLKNMGLFSAQLKDGTREVIEIKLMTQVTKDKSSGVLMRTVFNPLE